MKKTRHEFLETKKKSITLIGMSGVGKTYLSGLLENWGWARYSCDFQIGNVYLKDQLAEQMQSPEDMGALSAFIGKLGNPELSGLPKEEFKKRQMAYYYAECLSIGNVGKAIEKAHEDGFSNFVHDSTGSLCEIMDENLLVDLGQNTLFVYLRAGAQEEQLVLERAREFPKPLFFPPSRFDEWVDEYLYQHALSSSALIEPDDFARWVFPKLFEARLPKYQRLADLYGVTVACSTFYDVTTEKGFIERIAKALDE